MSSNCSPLDCLGLPDDITRKMQLFHTNPICQDKYFQYSKKRRLYIEMTGERQLVRPIHLLDMYACHMASFFRFTVSYSGYTGFTENSLAGRLMAGDGELDWGGPNVWHIVCDDAEDSAKFLPNSGTTIWHKFITKYTWLCEFVQESKEFSRSGLLKKIKHTLVKVCAPDKSMTKRELITILDRNYIPYFKSWNKSKLINAWYKSP
tara:strand:- start:183 stop:800 length:618 start_codon:yes stop_codon:yes gene_type:complete